MNLYDKKQVKCSICGAFLGEILNNSSILFPLCGACTKAEKKISRKGIDKILVPIDDTKKSQRTLDVAIYLTKYLGSSLVLFKVMPNMATGEFSFIKDAMKELRQNAEKSIKTAKNYCEDKNVVAKHLVVKGDEAEEIIKTAIKYKIDLIVMGSSGKNALKELIFGSVSNYVMHNSNIPVMIVKEKSVKLGTRKPKVNKPKKLRRQGGGVSLSKMKQKAGMEN
ncbi:universal stress protein [Nitrosopumilus sp. K4]|uniref:universal stress protein n=1 Tax=Nitrosopumilus sp. K4 TaxID=2795383 RepID=UPI001BA4898B|nr:universal stress protein [Nitrosopumilus sp. K4]QUC65156.1 universal stress protein [Nitrosopumilus sp. K4]